MASRPRKRWSIGLPPNLSELMNRLIEYANSFIREFDNSGAEMREILGEFKKIVAQVKQMQERTDRVRTAGGVIGVAGIGIGLGIIAAPFSGGASLAAAAAATAVVGANISKMMKENVSAERVEKLGKEFMKIIEPLKDDLEEIKMMCEKLEEESGRFLAEDTLTDVEEFQWILRRVAGLRKRSEEAQILVAAVMQTIGNLLVLIVKVFRVTATPKEDKKFRASIIQSADQCQKVINQFDQMKKELKDFKETKVKKYYCREKRRPRSF